MLLADATPSLRTLIPPGTIALTRRFLEQAPPSRRLDFALRYPWSRLLLLATERVALPGIVRHYLVRKQCIESHVRDFLNAHRGGQVVILGAGLDTLAWHLQAEGAAKTFELDHPATQSIKRRANIDPAPFLIPADFTRDCPAAALACAADYSTAQPTIIVAEGLFMYLPPDRVAQILSTLARATTTDSRLALTFMERHPTEPLGFRGGHRLINAWLRWKREPFLWGEERSRLGAFLSRHGWRLEHLSSPAELRTRFLAGATFDSLPLAEGESIALARRL
jgi:methyltransferase (TIGR00027 family)